MSYRQAVLQDRGVFKTEYAQGTYRHKLFGAGDTATVRIHYPLAEREIDTVVSLTRRDGRWYLTDYLRHADAVLAAVPAPDTLPPAPAADGEEAATEE